MAFCNVCGDPIEFKVHPMNPSKLAPFDADGEIHFARCKNRPKKVSGRNGYYAARGQGSTMLIEFEGIPPDNSGSYGNEHPWSVTMREGQASSFSYCRVKNGIRFSGVGVWELEELISAFVWLAERTKMSNNESVLVEKPD